MSYPEHEVLSLPALSPTMETGKLVEWCIEEGGHVYEGDMLCNVETDKAVVAFDATEEGYLAKIIVESGGDDLLLGTPIGIFVTEKEDIEAF